MRLIVDVGGTNIRFATACAGSQPISNIVQTPWTAHSSFIETLKQYLAGLSPDVVFEDAALAAAGPVSDGVVSLTNRNAVISSSEISQHIGGAFVNLYNDLEAVALALPHLRDEDKMVLRGGAALPDATKLALNVGTGFGGAPVFKAGNDWHAIPAEPGFIGMQPRDESERQFFNGCSVIEDYVSGRGLIEREAAHPDHPMLELGSENFSWHLGYAAGDVAASTGAWGGIYFVGGVFDAWPINDETMSAFLSGFDDRGLMRDRMRDIAIYKITLESPALLGLANAV